MIIYRVENLRDGLGMYGSCYSRSVGSSPYGHPLIGDEIGWGTVNRKMDAVSYNYEISFSEWFWGFANLPQLRKWIWSDDDLDYLHAGEFVIKLYELTQPEFYIEAPLQVIFVRKFAHCIGEMSLLNAKTVSPEGVENGNCCFPIDHVSSTSGLRLYTTAAAQSALGRPLYDRAGVPGAEGGRDYPRLRGRDDERDLDTDIPF